ncbi:hypothetical protein D083_1907 [Dickeya solani RNS 08.23.3.1.A]|nr:hypothetical protein D083_1907 [Dickeya solani RNS 08.23.3.1.A]
MRKVVDVLTGGGQRRQARAQHSENDKIAKHIPELPAGLKVGSVPEALYAGKRKKSSMKR